MTPCKWVDHRAVLVLNGDKQASTFADSKALDGCVLENLWSPVERALADQKAQALAIFDFRSLGPWVVKITPENLGTASGTLSADVAGILWMRVGKPM
jgi:hypothetical protein